MNQLKPADSDERRRILRASLWALAVGILLTVVVVLPAEYGVDPTGLGELTGLTSLAQAKSKRASESVADPAPLPINADASGVAPPLKVWSISHGDRFHVGTFEVPLKGDEELEYKAQLSRGEPLLYTWRVKEGTQVYFEFHGQPTEGSWPKDYYESYEKGEGAGGQGSMVAPFTGEHGWYWLNLSEKPITIMVELVGYYGAFGRYQEAAGSSPALPAAAPEAP